MKLQPLSLLTRGRSPLEIASLAAPLIAILAGSVYLFPFWRESPELSHAFFTPVLCLWLLALSSREPNLLPSARRVRLAISGSLVVIFAITVCTAALAAIAQGTHHSQTAFLTASSLALLLAGSVSTLARMRRPVVNFNGTSLCAAGLWIFAAPLSSGMLSRLTLFLQDRVTAFALQTLQLVGIPSMRQGNVLILADQYVGVEEACSGIRSLIACLFAGVFMGGLLLRGIIPRIGVVLAAGTLAVVANFGRALLLCLLVANGVDIGGFWHDGTAYLVLGFTVISLYGLCTLIAAKPTSREQEDPTPSSPSIRIPLLPISLAGFALVLAAFVGFRQQPAVGESQTVPNLAALMQMEVPGWIRRTDTEIAQFSDALNTDHLHQETYLRGDTQVTFYMAYWASGQSTLGSVSVHTPDLCLPGAGWTSLSPPAAISDYPLPQPQRFSFVKEEYPQHVWFWHVFGGHLVERLPNLYPWELGSYLLRRPVSSRAPQWVLRVSSNQPLETLQDEPLFLELFTRIRNAGLTAIPGS